MPLSDKSGLYHVQFFGEEEERAWIPETRLELYISKDAHLKWLAMKRKASKSSRKVYSEAPPGRRRGAWDIACLESEDAISMDRPTRRAQYTLVYTDNSGKSSAAASKNNRKSSATAAKINKKRKLSVASSDATTDTATKTDDTAGDADDGAGTADDDKSPPKKRRRRRSSPSSSQPDSLLLPDPTHVQFLVYSAKKRQSFRREHPGFTEAKLTQMLKRQWDTLSADEKSKYIPMGSDVKDVCSPGR